MPDAQHVHLILTLPSGDALRAALGEAHRRYFAPDQFRPGWTGYLWQGRFASYPMDDAHLMTAVHYVELNPVRATLVRAAEHWRGSSARAHVTGRDDGFTDLGALAGVHRNWRAMLRRGLEAGGGRRDRGAHARRPAARERFVRQRLERKTGRELKRRKPGPKPRQVEN